MPCSYSYARWWLPQATRVSVVVSLVRHLLDAINAHYLWTPLSVVFTGTYLVLSAIASPKHGQLTRDNALDEC